MAEAAPNAVLLAEPAQSARATSVKVTGPASRPMLYSTLGEALSTPMFSDVRLVTRDSSLEANKLILYSQCSKLSSQLMSDTEEIELDIDVNILKYVLSYIYVNSADIAKADLEFVEEASESLGVEELRVQCIRAQLHQEITVDNCLHMWVKASEVKDKDIVKKIEDFALKNFVKLQKSSAFCALPYPLLQHYICHQDLTSRSHEERFSAALKWVRADISGRIPQLVSLLDALPLSRMGEWYLDHLLLEPVIKALPEAVEKITKTLEGVTDEERQKADIPAAARAPMDRCLVFVGACIQGRVSREVKAIRLDLGLDVLSLGQVEGVITGGLTNCHLVGGELYVCGLGKEKNEVWSHDLKDGKSKLVARMNTPRQGHALFLASDSHLHIMGGWTPGTLTDVSSVEAIHPTIGSCTLVGHLKHKDCIRLACCQVAGGDEVIVCGGRVAGQQYSCIQAYSTRTSRTSHTIRLDDDSCSFVYGIVQVRGHLIVVAEDYTAVVSVDDVLHGRSTSLTLSKHFITPNDWCAVVLSEDDTRLMLLGGKPKHDEPKCYVYSSTVEDILNDTQTGWQQDNTAWTLGTCVFYGYDIGYIAKTQE